jgi:hypothetical protein
MSSSPGTKKRENRMLNPSDRARIEVILTEALARAKLEYEASKVEFDLAVRKSEDLRLNRPDGCVALAQATKAQKQTQYYFALTRFNQFILDDAVPGDL